MSERRLTNAYWIEVGTLRERDRILALLEEWVADDYGDFSTVLARIIGEKGD